MNNLETYKIQDNGKNYIFRIKENTTEPCPTCKTPACGKEDFLWYEIDNQRITVVFDGGLLNAELSDFFEKNVTKDNYHSIPNFIKEWNEDKGWSINDDFRGFNLNHLDFIKSIELIIKENNKWLTNKCLHGMKNLSLEAKNLGLTLKIVRS